jgi:RES domain-containing protein
MKKRLDIRPAVRTEWHDFGAYLKKNSRFTLNRTWERFVKYIISTCETRKKTNPTSSMFYRARIGEYRFKKTPWPNKFADMYPHPLNTQQMKAAPARFLSEGRINPAGISYLYLTNKIETAILESKPWIGCYVTVARFALRRSCKVIDMTHELKKPEKRGGGWRSYEESIWFSMSVSFSDPVDPTQKSLDYLPTQFVAEHFRHLGYDGILYKSAVKSHGLNLVLFDGSIAEPETCALFAINGYKIQSEPVGRWQTNSEMRRRPNVIF